MTKAKIYYLTKRQIENLCIEAILESKDGTWKRTWIDKKLKQLPDQVLNCAICQEKVLISKTRLKQEIEK